MSNVQGSLDPPLSTSTLPEYFITDILRRHGASPALICRNELPGSHGGPSSKTMTCLSWNFYEFDKHITALARGLLSMGVRKGDRVGVVMGNNSSYAMLQWACASIGAILATINPAYRTHELIATLKLAEVQHLIIVPRIRTSEYVHMLSDALPGLKSSSPGNIQEEALPDLRSLIVVDNQEVYKQELDRLDVKSIIDWREVLMWREDTNEASLLQQISESLRPDDAINLQFTRFASLVTSNLMYLVYTCLSGTTGVPKAVSLTHTNLLNNALSIGSCMSLTDKDVVCNVPPLFHCFGLILGNLAAWVYGAAIVYASEIFNPKAIIDAVVEEKCTALHGVPTHFLGVLQEVDSRRAAGEHLDTSNLRTGIAAGSPIPIELMKRLIAQMNLRDLTNAYGMTETSPVSFQTVPSDPLIKRVETVGRVQPHVKAKLVDNEGNVVPVNTPGEICVAGYLVQKGYWKDEEQTRQVIHKDPGDDENIWMHTGDEGIMDEEGYLRVVSRIKDIIIRGGENLFPVQIENVLTASPGIREAAVVSVPDNKYGEVVGAWIVRTPGSAMSREEVRQVVSEEMNPQNAPAWVWFIGEDTKEDLPKTASGKVMKHVLREWSRNLARQNMGKVQI